MTAKEILSLAKAKLVLNHPFFASLVLGMNIEEKDAEFFAFAPSPTMATDGKNIYYFKEFVESLTVNQVVGVLAHEGCHVGFLHHTRRQSRNVTVWNIAADASINPILKDSGFELPDDCIMGPPNCYAEAEYARLYKEMKGGNGGKGNGKKYKAWGEVIDPSGKDGGKATREEIQAAEQEAKIKIVQALEQSKNRGNVPAGIARLVQEILEPKVDWKQLLRNLIDQVARNDYNWQTPNRRFIHSGIYVPGIKSRELGTVVVAEDTSGSVGQKALDQFNSELTSIVEEFDTNVWLLPTDVKVHNPQEFTRHDLPLKAKICGGGGTSFRHPFEWVNEQEISPTVMIYLTDGWCDEFPKFTPDYPVIWVVTENKSLNVPWGDLIFMDLTYNNGR